MEVLVGILAVFIAFVVGWNIRDKATGPTQRLRRTQAIDRANYLQALRREIANILIYRDPPRYLGLYRRLHEEVSSLSSWRPEEVRRRHAELCEKYPNYTDFDAFGTREYVLYPDALSMDDDELEEHYRDLVVFTALCVIGDDDWKDGAKSGFIRTTDAKELAHLATYAQRIMDTKLTLRLQQAMEDRRSYAKTAGGEGGLDNADYSFARLPDHDEMRYGIHLKRVNEYGICSFFVFEDSKITYSYFRSDPSFEEAEPLRPLQAVLDERQLFLHGLIG